MRKSDRLFQLTNILRAHQPITARELAQKLSVSERTIYRYMDDLSVSGIPVYGEPGIGYCLSEGFELPPLKLTSEELEALVAGVNFVAELTSQEFGYSARALLSKIEAALAASQAAALDRKERIVRVPLNRENSRSRTWGQLHSAIIEKLAVKMDYCAANGELTHRTAFPLGLFYWGGKWTVGCWCLLRSDYRDFRLDRIGSVAVIDSSVRLPQEASLASYLHMREKSVL